jgi:hypothetical protein
LIEDLRIFYLMNFIFYKKLQHQAFLAYYSISGQWAVNVTEYFVCWYYILCFGPFFLYNMYNKLYTCIHTGYKVSWKHLVEQTAVSVKINVISTLTQIHNMLILYFTYWKVHMWSQCKFPILAFLPHCLKEQPWDFILKNGCGKLKMIVTFCHRVIQLYSSISYI